MLYFCDLRGQEFWDHTWKQGDTSAVYIQKVIGYKTRLSKYDNDAVQEEDEAWSSADSEEGYWKEDEETARVSRLYADQCDPSSAGANQDGMVPCKLGSTCLATVALYSHL